MTLPGWAVPMIRIGKRLPAPYSLREDEHLAYLCDEEGAVAVFSSETATLKTIEAALEANREKRKTQERELARLLPEES